MQFKKEAPWQSDVVLGFRDVAAEVEVDAPEEISEEEARFSIISKSRLNMDSSLTDAKRSELSHALPVLLILHSFTDQLGCFSDYHNDHDCEHNLVDIDLIGHDVVGRDRNQYAKDGESVVPSLSWRGLEAEQLMKQCTDSEKHWKEHRERYITAAKGSY